AGVGGFDFHVIVEAEQRDRDPNLAAERRSRRRAQNHHDSTFDVIDCVCGSALLRQCSAKRNATDQRSAGRPHGISQRVVLPHDAATSPYPVTTRLTAFGPLPFLSGSTSKLMRWPSTSDFSPARSTAVMCTNTSRPPSSGLMKPYTRSPLTNLTVPVIAIDNSAVLCVGVAPHGTTARPDIHMGKEHQPQTASVTPPAP